MEEILATCERLNAGTWPRYHLDVHGKTWRKGSATEDWKEITIEEPKEAGR